MLNSRRGGHGTIIPVIRARCLPSFITSAILLSVALRVFYNRRPRDDELRDPLKSDVDRKAVANCHRLALYFDRIDRFCVRAVDRSDVCLKYHAHA